MLKKFRPTFAGCLASLVFLTACTYNPFSPGSPNNRLTGTATATATGAATGTATGLLFDLPSAGVAALGLGGGAAGYYFSTKRFAEGGIIQAGGQVFSVGDYTTIEIPTDYLFESNSSDFLPSYEPILLSTMDVLNRYPENNILISGNTSGIASAKYERRLSEARARQVAGFLWSHGINNFHGNSIELKNLRYVGYGDYFPIANHIKPESLRQNSRIQITSYPRRDQLDMDSKINAFNNIGNLSDPEPQRSASADMNNELPTGDVLAENAAASNPYKD